MLELGRRRRRHLVLEPLSGRPLRFGEHHLRVLVLRELLQEWDWKERFSGQPENLRYLQYVTDKFDLRRHMQFNCTVEAMVFDETRDLWRCNSTTGGT